MKISPEDIILNKKASDKKTNIIWFHTYEIFRVVKSRTVVVREWGERRMGSYYSMSTVSVLEDEKRY
jgi:hypothetical protein